MTILPSVKQLNEKTARSINFHYPRPLAFRPRSRHLLIAILLLCIYFYSSSSSSSSSSPSAETYHNGPSPYKIQATFPQESADAQAIRLERRGQVKDAFRHAWKGYNHYGWMHDEVMPVSGKHKDNFVGWAATLVDSLDSLYIMGLQEKFDEALEALEEIDFSKPNANKVPVFEVTIRYLGGLLGAWDVTEHKYPILLQKATQLGDFLTKAFHTQNGLPVPYYWWKNQTSGRLAGVDNVIIAQVASLSMEFIRLSQVTGNKTYAAHIQVITDQLKNTQNDTALPGMWPLLADCSGKDLSFSDERFSLGVLADSAFEYLPKTHLLDHRTSDQYLQMYRIALDTFSKHLFFRPSVPGNPDILMSGNLDMSTDPPAIDGQFQHLACFVGGMVALGSRISASTEELETAAKLTNGCVWGYDNTPTGIMPDFSHVEPCQDPTLCIWSGHGNGFKRVDDPSYQLRPEAIESVFIMYRLTADPIWMEKGWKMFQAIQKHTRTSIANARIVDVMKQWPTHEDTMDSYWLAETLKYFYLLFSEPDLISLDEYVLNTEAHPFRWG
ncbi:putative mannosyl-oligosaccharide 1,2-alpha-mannosidase IB [Rhexocercosporidium sp. MPI-PUGE-AT-0058]|nr:putative mannosyl-oligosaccharide 1,2-alpha-mannosidase IB [Rhexocercosporidium sp. MPI-PUGE-AT-0058]